MQKNQHQVLNHLIQDDKNHVEFIHCKLNTIGINVTKEKANELYIKQLDLEDFSRKKGVLQYTKNISGKIEKGIESKTPYGNSILSHYFPLVKSIIENYMQSDSRSIVGPLMNLKGLIKNYVDVEVCTLIVLSELFNCCHQDGRAVAGVAHSIGRSLEFECLIGAFQEHNKERYDQIIKKFLTNHAIHRRRVFCHAFSTEPGFEAKRWDSHMRYSIGHHLLKLAESVIDVLEIHIECNSKGKQLKNKPAILRPKDSLLKWIEDFNKRRTAFVALNNPMVVPPLPWSRASLGGYFDPTQHQPLVGRNNKKGFDTSYKYSEKVGKLSDAVFDCANHLQNVPWKLNRFIFDTLSHAVDNNLSLGSVVKVV